jgi:heme/copper-type cytochrome/quinol oxidase subunit 2
MSDKYKMQFMIIIMIALIVYMAFLPFIISLISKAENHLINNSLSPLASTAISVIFAAVPIIIMTGYILIQLNYMRPIKSTDNIKEV